MTEDTPSKEEPEASFCKEHQEFLSFVDKQTKLYNSEKAGGISEGDAVVSSESLLSEKVDSLHQEFGMDTDHFGTKTGNLHDMLDCEDAVSMKSEEVKVAAGYLSEVRLPRAHSWPTFLKTKKEREL